MCGIRNDCNDKTDSASIFLGLGRSFKVDIYPYARHPFPVVMDGGQLD